MPHFNIETNLNLILRQILNYYLIVLLCPSIEKLNNALMRNICNLEILNVNCAKLIFLFVLTLDLVNDMCIFYYLMCNSMV